MFPIKDDNPTFATPVVTLALIAANLAVWAMVQGLGAGEALGASVCRWGLIPGELLGTAAPGTAFPLGPQSACVLEATPNWLSVVSSMFLHGGWFHLLGNMWFLWVFGNNVEDSMGRGRYLAFYLLCGLAAAAAQVLADPASAIPMVGASGAIGGVMGAYVILYPRVRVTLLVILVVFVTTFRVPAFLMLGYWFLTQLLQGTVATGEAGGVAFWAHVGGFAAGALLVFIFRDPDLVRRHRQSVLAAHGGRWA
ncbi:MAG: rhomboid family intramembrane serine protease [Gemmatimonadales bacterium]|nr:rhomboid family intramembrane serine protease [Gemmatimonadales bacterium]